MGHARLARSALALALAFLLLAGSSGCAALTGMVSGPFTGMVSAPAEVHRHNRGEFSRTPVYWFWNVLVMVPVGGFAGPLAGFSKGLSLDIQWLRGEMAYRRVFNTYHEESVWRPYVIHW